MQPSRRGRLLLAQRANVDRYPPVLHQATLLGSRFDIAIVDRVGLEEGDETVPLEHVERLRVREASRNGGLAAFGRIAEMSEFSRTVGDQMTRRPDVAIAYDAESAALLLRSPVPAGSLKRVVHLHELFDMENLGWLTRRSVRYLRGNLPRADLVVVPDAHRAEMIREEYALRTSPMVVMNCPLLLRSLPDSRLLPALRQRGVSTRNIVHYQGAVGPDHSLESIIASMTHWPSNAVLVVVGGGSETYRKHLLALAAADGCADRVILLGRVPYSEVLSFAVGAAVGLTLLEPTIDNQRFCAGASNKRFEYAALGIPQVTNTGAGMNETFGIPGLALLVDPLDSASIGRAIRGLLDDPQRMSEMGQHGRAAHLSVNHYERQFAPVRKLIESWLRDER